jgi:hypothetical protein
MSQPGAEFSLLPRRFPAWPGLAAACLVAGGLWLAGASGVLPPSLWTESWRLLLVAHALAVFALVTLAGEQQRVRAWARVLEIHDQGSVQEAGKSREGSGPAWPLGLLQRPHRGAEFQRMLGDIRDVLRRDLGRRWALCQALCFAIPLYGCLLTLWNLRLVSNAVPPFREVGLPLIVTVVEVFPILLMVTALARDAQLALDRWHITAEVLALSAKGPVSQESAPEHRPPGPGHTDFEMIEPDVSPVPVPVPVAVPEPVRVLPDPPTSNPPYNGVQSSHDPVSPPTKPKVEPEPVPIPAPDESSDTIVPEPRRPKKPKPFDPSEEWG